MPAKQRSKYGAAWDRQSRRLRAGWTADPTTRCAMCGLTHSEGVERYGARLAAWEADHPDGRTDIPPRPAHATCNRSEGAARGNRMRASPPRSRDW